MMAVNTIVDLTILTIGAGIQASQEGYGSPLRFVWSIFVFKTARVPLRTGAPQVMIIAKFVVVLSFLDVIQSCLVDLQRWIQSPGARIPSGSLLAPHDRRFDRFWLKRQSYLRGRACALDGSSIRGRNARSSTNRGGGRRRQRRHARHDSNRGGHGRGGRRAAERLVDKLFGA